MRVVLGSPAPFSFADVLDAIGCGAELHVRWTASRAAMVDREIAVFIPWGWACTLLAWRMVRLVDRRGTVRVYQATAGYARVRARLERALEEEVNDVPKAA